tara:strand:+ start:1564 stop:1935 length:372 start_codon:yes stop_codon:yes gene_type:complete
VGRLHRPHIEKKGEKEMDVTALENTLKEQMTAGIVTETEMRRIMARATGGVYLNEAQKEQYEAASDFINGTLEVLNKLQIVGPAREDSTRRKLEAAVVKHIVNNGEFNADGSPNVSDLESYWA